MSFRPFPRTAAWRHHGARDGFEVAYFSAASPFGGGAESRITGCTTAVEEGRPWVADYDIALNAEGATRSARVTVRSAEAIGSVLLESDGAGAWRVDGSPAPESGRVGWAPVLLRIATNAIHPTRPGRMPRRRLGSLGPDQRAPPAPPCARCRRARRCPGRLRPRRRPGGRAPRAGVCAGPRRRVGAALRLRRSRVRRGLQAGLRRLGPRTRLPRAGVARRLRPVPARAAADVVRSRGAVSANAPTHRQTTADAHSPNTIMTFSE